MSATREESLMGPVWRVVAVALIGGGLTLNAVLYNGIKTELSDIGTKIFHHMTNDEIHVPREYFVTKAEFDMYAKFSAQDKVEVIGLLKDLKDNVKDINKNLLDTNKRVNKLIE